ncbi:MAG: MarR family transcriptional regulator [Rhodobacteraceae bacterium]|nr:MarR family transcriptional regulator [Paracoccaceae bacterium]
MNMSQTSETSTALLKSIRRLARALDMHSRHINRESGLTLPQLIVLRCVRELGEVTGRAISEAADLSPPTVVGILDKLETKGLIERYRSTRDRRIVHTRLSGTGRALLDRSPSPLGARFETRFMALEARERAEILEAFRKAADLALEPAVQEAPEDDGPDLVH